MRGESISYDAFYEYEDDLNALDQAYVLKNKAMFS